MPIIIPAGAASATFPMAATANSTCAVTNVPDMSNSATAWFDELSDNVVDRGNPVFERTTLGDCGPETVLGGYTLIAADNLDAAGALAANCPMLAGAGGVEVGELTSLNRSCGVLV